MRLFFIDAQFEIIYLCNKIFHKKNYRVIYLHKKKCGKKNNNTFVDTF